jgi:hypothetical protein
MPRPTLDGWGVRKCAWLWYLAVMSITLQMILSLLLLRREFHRRLNFAVAPAA